MHIVITNGPPGSGKDTFTKIFLEEFPDAVWMRYKNVLYVETWKDLFVNEDGTHEISLDEWIEICNDVVLKESPLPYNLERNEIMLWKESPEVYGNSIYCKTPRNHLIYKSENEIKVKHGDAGVAVITAGYIKEIPDWQNKLFIFSDGGFNVEINALIEELGITRDDLTIIRIDAEGCNFDNDSREYIVNPNIKLFNKKDDTFANTLRTEVFPIIKAFFP